MSPDGFCEHCLTLSIHRPKAEGYIQCDTSVQTGTTAGVVWLFELQDNSTVSVECGDGQKFDVELQN